jgi:hypothetical protein
VFEKTFVPRLCDTAYGTKLLPAANAVWKLLASYDTGSIEQAVISYLAKKPITPLSSPEANPVQPEANPISLAPPVVRPKPEVKASTAQSKAASEGEVFGVLRAYGVEKFPDREKPGKTYDNFAIRLETRSGERVLQGEGLKDAIENAGAKIGVKVGVRRLNQIAVPLFDDRGGPIKDARTGEQKMGKKWLWQMRLLKD